MLGDDVGALVDQGLGGVRLLARIIPGVDPDHLDLGVGVDLAHGQGERVDAANHLGDREGADIADDVGLGHVAGDGAEHRPALVEARQIGRDVIGALVAGRVLELHVLELLGDLDGRVHEAEGGGEDQVVAVGGQLADDAFGVRPLAYALDEAGLDGLSPNSASIAWRPMSWR